MKLINNLVHNISNENCLIVKQLTDIIAEEKILNEEQLLDYENNLFLINGKSLSIEERIDYCIKIYEGFPFSSRDLNDSESLQTIDLYKQLKKEININEKIKVLIKLFVLIGKNLYFPYLAYNFIINKQL